MTGVKVEFSTEDIYIFRNCMNEVANGVHIGDWEFETRVGVDRNQVRDLLERTNKILGNSLNQEGGNDV